MWWLRASVRATGRLDGALGLVRAPRTRRATTQDRSEHRKGGVRENTVRGGCAKKSWGVAFVRLGFPPAPHAGDAWRLVDHPPVAAGSQRAVGPVPATPFSRGRARTPSEQLFG